MEYDFNVLYYIDMCKRWRKTIVKFMAIVIFFTIIFSYLIPVKYLSTVTIISADSGSSTVSSLGKFLGISDMLGGSSLNDITASIINSNRMAKDIKAYLELNKKTKFKYSIATRSIKAGMVIEVRGNDPVYTEKVANFSVQNLDKINSELNITPSKPMVKVLDSAVYGIRQSRNILRNVIVACLLGLIFSGLYASLADYNSKIKSNLKNNK